MIISLSRLAGLLILTFCVPGLCSTGPSVNIEELVNQQREIQRNFCTNEATSRVPAFTHNLELKQISFLGATFRMFLYCNGHDLMNCDIKRDGVWEPSEGIALVNTLSQHLRSIHKSPNNVTFLDIGANVGWYTLLMAALGYKVIAIEPDAFNMYLLRKSLCLNPRMDVTLLQIGVGNTTRECDLYRPNDFYTNIMVFCDEMKGKIRDHTHLGKIKILPLDLLAPYIPELVAIKIDIEGFEPYALAGGHKVFFGKHPKLVMSEYNPPEMATKMSNGTYYVETMIANGFNMTMDNCANRVLSNEESRRFGANRTAFANVCFIRPN